MPDSTPLTQTLFKAVLLSLIIYIIITSLYEWQFNDNIVRSYTILKSDIESKINLGADGVLTFTSDPYYEGKQLKIFSNLQHTPEILDHALTCLYATLQNSGPLNLVLYLGYIYPLRQMLDLGKYVFYEGTKKIIILNLGRALRIDILDVS